MKKFLERVIVFKIEFRSRCMDQSKTRDNLMIYDRLDIGRSNNRNNTNRRRLYRFSVCIVLEQCQKQHTESKRKECRQKYYSGARSYHYFVYNKNKQLRYNKFIPIFKGFKKTPGKNPGSICCNDYTFIQEAGTFQQSVSITAYWLLPQAD